MADFSVYLNTPMDDIPDNIPSLPVGHYFATITNWITKERFYDTNNPKKGTAVVELTFRIIGPDDDVEGDLPEGGGKGTLISKDYDIQSDLRGKVNLRKIAKIACGLPVDGQDLPDVLDALKGQDVKVHNSPRPNKKAEGEYFNNIDMVLSAG